MGNETIRAKEDKIKYLIKDRSKWMYDSMKNAFSFDFNKNKMPNEITFEEKVGICLTNELGNCMLPAAIQVLIIQFRKFMVLTSYCLYDCKHKSENNLRNHYYDLEQYVEWCKMNNEVIFESCFQPSTIIDIIWKLLIQDSETYKEFCFNICGSYIDRIESVSIEISLDKYFAFI